MGVYGLKPAFRKLLRPTMAFAKRFEPNTISMVGVLFAVAAAAALYFAPGRLWLYLVVPVLLFLRIACNALDGMVAVERKMASGYGELVNEWSDRINDVVIFTGLAVSGAANLMLCFGILAAIHLVTTLGIIPRAAGGRRRYDGPFGKADRMVALGIVSILAYLLPATGVATHHEEVINVGLGFMLLLVPIGLLNRWGRASRELRMM